MTRPGGLAVLFDEELRTEREPAKAPAKRWRNWWRSLEDGYDDGDNWRPRGLLFRGRRIYPSKDIAESHAAQLLAEDFARLGNNPDEYLGAYPDEEQPNNT